MKKLFLYSILSSYLIISISCEDGIPETRGVNYYETLPAVAMDYKVHVDAGESENKQKIPTHRSVLLEFFE